MGVLVGGDTWDYARAPDSVGAKVTRLWAVVADFDVPLPAMALHFLPGHPGMVSVVPGLRSRAELKQTLAWTGMDIPSGVWDALREVDLLHPDAPVPEGNPFRAAGIEPR